MKKMKYILSLLLVALVCVGCSKDGDTITTAGTPGVTLGGSGDVVMTKEHKSALALTLHWTDNSHLQSSDDRVQLPIGTTANTLQFSATPEFTTTVDVLTETGTTSLQFLGETLNSIVGRVGLESDIASTLYIRMCSKLADNLDPVYSNVYALQVTPYTIDMTIGYILDANQADTGNTLSSPNKDGIYSGFMGVVGWQNFWLQEGDGTIWGNVGDEGGGTPFVVSKNEGSWNFWFPGQEGCYYSTVNTHTQEWSALYIPTLQVTGDITGEMTFDRKTCKWSLNYQAAKAGTATIKIAGTGSLYTVSTGVTDENAIATPVAFGQTNGTLTFGQTASAITVEVPKAGDVTLTLDLSDPKNYTCTVAEGSDTPTETTSQYLYILGNDDKWDYTEYLTLYDEEHLCYAAAAYFNSSWGYYFSKELNDWTEINQDNTTTEQKLTTKSSNIAEPGKGLYIVCASLGWMSYWYGCPDAVTRVSCTGFNDSWDLIDMTADTEHPGVYTAEVTATGNTPWGAQILINGNWDYSFGTYSDGTLRWTKKEDANPKGWEVGKTYTLTVDLCKCTYTLTEK